MPNPVQASTLITRVRQEANVEGATGFVPDAEIMDRLNRAMGEFVDLMREAGGQDYYRRTYVMQTLGNVDTYDLPGDFVSLISVDAFLTPSQVFTCIPYQEEQRNMYRWLGLGWVLGQPVYYRLADRYIKFIPMPAGLYTVQLNYVYTPTQFVIDATTNAPRGSVDDVNGFAEFMIFHAAAGVARKQKQFDTAQFLAAERERMADRIRRMAPQRDAGAPERVHDIESLNFTYWDE